MLPNGTNPAQTCSHKLQYFKTTCPNLRVLKRYKTFIQLHNLLQIPLKSVVCGPSRVSTMIGWQDFEYSTKIVSFRCTQNKLLLWFAALVCDNGVRIVAMYKCCRPPNSRIN